MRDGLSHGQRERVCLEQVDDWSIQVTWFTLTTCLGNETGVSEESEILLVAYEGVYSSIDACVACPVLGGLYGARV